MTLPDRFWAKVEKADTCWVWVGDRTPDGYGYYMTDWAGGRRPRRSAHRVALEDALGEPIPSDLVVDHLCRNRACVRADHLEAVPQAENLRRGATVVTTINAAKTHCPQGHPYDEANTRRDKHGYRSCRACQRTSARERYQRKAAS